MLPQWKNDIVVTMTRPTESGHVTTITSGNSNSLLLGNLAMATDTDVEITKIESA